MAKTIWGLIATTYLIGFCNPFVCARTSAGPIEFSAQTAPTQENTHEFQGTPSTKWRWGELQGKFKLAHPGAVWNAVWSPDDKKLGTVDNLRGINVWNSESGERTYRVTTAQFNLDFFWRSRPTANSLSSNP